MSREEAIEVINSLTGKDFPQEREASIKRQYQIAEALMTAIEALKADVPDTNVGKWILCSERLPEDDDYKPFSYYEDGAILYCTKDGKIGFGWYYESTKEWANEDDGYPGEVVAWMPLPEPYKEEDTK